MESGEADYGVLPIENSIGGTIHRNYDLLLAHELRIIGEVELPVVLNLVALPGTTLAAVRQIYSPPQALSQCERFLRSLPGVEVVATYDTAGRGRLIRERNLAGTAAIASVRAAAVLGLEVIAASIQDHPDNMTRYLVLGRGGGSEEAGPAPEPDKTTIVFALPNEPGAIFKALSVFALRGIDLTKLESRPIPGKPWEYLFYADLAVGSHEFRCGRALTHLAEFARWLRTLGSYRACARPPLPSPADLGPGRAVGGFEPDQIIPARFLKAIDKQGMGEALFADWRYAADGTPIENFVLNRLEYRGAQILLAGSNFGCGSSREHAPWALTGYGFRAVIAASFADIFRNNALKNGLLPVEVEAEVYKELARLCQETSDVCLVIDLEGQTISLGKW